MPLYEMNDVTFLIWKQTSKAILKLVCWFNFQVLVVLYFLPLIQVAFWQGAKKKKHEKIGHQNPHLDDIHQMWLQNPREKQQKKQRQ